MRRGRIYAPSSAIWPGAACGGSSPRSSSRRMSASTVCLGLSTCREISAMVIDGSAHSALILSIASASFASCLGRPERFPAGSLPAPRAVVVVGSRAPHNANIPRTHGPRQSSRWPDRARSVHDKPSCPPRCCPICFLAFSCPRRYIHQETCWNVFQIYWSRQRRYWIDFHVKPCRFTRH